MNYIGHEYASTGDICHYGRLGMKWYQHIYSKSRPSFGKKRKRVLTEDESNKKKSFKSDVNTLHDKGMDVDRTYAKKWVSNDSLDFYRNDKERRTIERRVKELGNRGIDKLNDYDKYRSKIYDSVEDWNLKDSDIFDPEDVQYILKDSPNWSKEMRKSLNAGPWEPHDLSPITDVNSLTGYYKNDHYRD